MTKAKSSNLFIGHLVFSVEWYIFLQKINLHATLIISSFSRHLRDVLVQAFLEGSYSQRSLPHYLERSTMKFQRISTVCLSRHL